MILIIKNGFYFFSTFNMHWISLITEKMTHSLAGENLNELSVKIIFYNQMWIFSNPCQMI